MALGDDTTQITGSPTRAALQVLAVRVPPAVASHLHDSTFGVGLKTNKGTFQDGRYKAGVPHCSRVTAVPW